MHYSRDLYEVDAAKISELMQKMEPHFDGYSRMVILMACTRVVAAMLAPGRYDTREGYLEMLPDYVRAMWRAMGVVGGDNSESRS